MTSVFSNLSGSHGAQLDLRTAQNEVRTIMKKRILLVEDETVVRAIVKQMLSKDQHAVVESNNGAEALGLFEKDKFDLVITDYRIPFMEGNELARRIKKLAPYQHILMMTAYGKKIGSDNPVDAVINKPFDCTKLRRAIAEVLGEPAEECECIAFAES